MDLISKPQITDSSLTGNLLINFPVSLFGSVMGMAGLSRALYQAAGLFKLNLLWAGFTGIISWVIFAILVFTQALKFFIYRKRVINDFIHPANGTFFGTVPIAILLLSTIIQPYSSSLYILTWCTGSLMMLIMAYTTCYRLLNFRQDPVNITPVLILPAAGILNIAVTGGYMPWAWAHELSIIALSIGGFLTIVLFTIIFSRLMYHDKLSITMQPTFMILMSPFAVCFLAYVSVTNSIDLFAAALFYFALFMFLILAFRIFFHQRTFIYTWWAVGFPVAALTNSALKYAQARSNLFSDIIAWVMLTVLIVLISGMLIRSFYMLFNKTLY